MGINKSRYGCQNKGTFGVGGGTAGGGNTGGNAGGAALSFGAEPEYVEATVKFNSKTWNHAGFRLKGN